MIDMGMPDTALRQRMQLVLRHGPATTAEIARHLQVSLQTVRRLLAELPQDALVRAGIRGQVRHALRRPLRDGATALPVLAVDDTGRAHELADLVPLASEGAFLPLPADTWPVPAESRDGWWEGLPYPLYAMRPTGYLGRLFARTEHAALGVSDDPDAWKDDDILWVLGLRGADAPGNLIVGGAAYDLWLRRKLASPAPLEVSQQPDAYRRLAENAAASIAGVSSAAGEFPKFVAMRSLEGARTPHVLVKFSGASETAAERRWADLLICEHWALEHARQLRGVHAVRSRALDHAQRVFLETERFDRVGQDGRLAVCSLDVIDPAFVGSRDTAWPAVAARLRGMDLLDDASEAAIVRLWWFGRLIANTDMHAGNLTFHVEGRFRLAPAYDMLPMAYAPLPGGEIPPHSFDPALPPPGQREPWLEACAVAIAFWNAAGADSRITDVFRRTCRDNAARLDAIAGKV